MLEIRFDGPLIVRKPDPTLHAVDARQQFNNLLRMRDTPARGHPVYIAGLIFC